MKAKILAFLEAYLKVLARQILTQYQPVIIGITGSVGKTTTKEAVAHLLETANLPYRKTEANLNFDIGIALTILGFNHGPAIWEWPMALFVTHLQWFLMRTHLIEFPKYFVVELGIDRMGDMDRLVAWIKPTIGIVTWVGEGHHLEFLKNPETIAREKGQMLTVLPKDGLAILPEKDDQFEVFAKLASAPIQKVKTTGLESMQEIVTYVGQYLKLSDKTIETALRSYVMPKGRMQQLRGVNGTTVIDDSYNASFPAMKLALSLLTQAKGKRKIAVLGDILEQGKYEDEMHLNIAKLAKASTDLFVGVGKRMKKVAPVWYATPEEAAKALPEFIQKNDVILVKGSQGMRMEKISSALALDKHEAKQKLPRQSVRWQQIPFSNP